MFQCVLVSCCLLTSLLQVWKGSHWHLEFCSRSLILYYALKQDLKDLMRKAGEVTFVDAHRPNKNEGWVALLSVKTSLNSLCLLRLVLMNVLFLLQYRVVEFASRSDMKNAISKLDGTELNGRKLKIFEDSRRWVVVKTVAVYMCLHFCGPR